MERSRRISRLNKCNSTSHYQRHPNYIYIAIAAILILFEYEKSKEPHIILAAAIAGLMLKLLAF